METNECHFVKIKALHTFAQHLNGGDITFEFISNAVFVTIMECNKELTLQAECFLQSMESSDDDCFCTCASDGDTHTHLWHASHVASSARVL